MTARQQNTLAKACCICFKLFVNQPRKIKCDIEIWHKWSLCHFRWTGIHESASAMPASRSFFLMALCRESSSVYKLKQKSRMTNQKVEVVAVELVFHSCGLPLAHLIKIRKKCSIQIHLTHWTETQSRGPGRNKLPLQARVRSRVLSTVSKISYYH